MQRIAIPSFESVLNAPVLMCAGWAVFLAVEASGLRVSNVAKLEMDTDPNTPPH